MANAYHSLPLFDGPTPVPPPHRGLARVNEVIVWAVWLPWCPYLQRLPFHP